MNETRNSKSLLESIGELETKLRERFVDGPMEWITQARAKMKDLPKTNFDLGCDFAARGLLNDAIFRFNMVLRWKADYPQVWYNLGCCYYRKGEFAKAADALKKAIAQDPVNRDAIYMLAAIEPAAVPTHLRPTRMPKHMVQQFFTGQAGGYDLAERQNQYQPQLIFDILKPFVKATNPSILDLGCGTGLAARPWRASASQITGVDVIPAMLEMARAAQEANRPLYDTLVESDLAEPVPVASDTKADILLCINTASYIGELAPLIQRVRGAAKTGGLFVITTDFYKGEGFGLNAESGRFGHNPAYVKQLAVQFGFTTLHEQRVELYPNAASQLQVFQVS